MNLKTVIYENSPYYVQNMLCSLLGRNIMNARFNDYFFSLLEDLNKSQYANKEDILKYKEEHLRQIIEYAYFNVPYYKESFDKCKIKPNDFKSLLDLEKFPVLTKEDVRNNYNKMIATNYNKKHLVHSHTSGSSGKALDFVLTKESIPYQWAIWWRLRNKYGIGLGAKHLNCVGKLVVPIKTRKPPYWRINKPLNQWIINMQHITKDKINYYVDMINEESFIYISGYPSIISSLASLICESNFKIENSPRLVFSGAEKMFDYQKQLIEKAFPDIMITDHYGTSEGVINATKCSHGIYHEDYEFGHIECLNPRWISPTDYTGPILGTGFTNMGMPFIRYQMGDSAIWSISECKCGLHSQVIKDIEGRNEDFVITPEGARIMRFDYLFKDTSDIKECQVVQSVLGQITLRIVKRDNYSVNTEKQIITHFKDMISPTMKVIFEYVDEIPRTSAGKFKAVISNIK